MLVVLSLLLVLAAFGLLLAVPVELRFEASGEPNWKARLRVGWLYGRVGRDIEPRASARPKQKSKRRFPTLQQLDLLRQEPFWTRAKLMLLRCRPYLDIEEIAGDLRVGFDDPADTGMAFGLIQPLVRGLAALPRVDLRLAPDFEGGRGGGDLRGAVRIVPIGLLAHGIAFALSPEAIGTVRRLRSLGK